MITRGITSGSNHKVAAAWNRRLVLRLLKRHDSLSRRQISDMTGLQGSTLTYIVREFLERKVLHVAGKADSQRVGQKQVMLKINPKLGYVVGASLAKGRAKLVLLDAGGNRIDATEVPISASLKAVPEDLRSGLDAWLDRIGRPAGRLLGIGVAVPGVVDSELGLVLASTPFNAKQVPFRDLLSQHFDATIVIEHDANFGATAEAEEGAARHVRDFVYFLVNHTWDAGAADFRGFGAALYLEDKVYSGAHFAAGELDTTLVPHRPFHADAAELAALAEPTAALSPATVDFATQLAKPMASIVNLLDVSMIVLGGNSRIVNEQFLGIIREQVAKSLVHVPGRSVEVAASQIADEAVARGAAIAASYAGLESSLWSDEPADESVSVSVNPSTRRRINQLR